MSAHPALRASRPPAMEPPDWGCRGAPTELLTSGPLPGTPVLDHRALRLCGRRPRRAHVRRPRPGLPLPRLRGGLGGERGRVAGRPLGRRIPGVRWTRGGGGCGGRGAPAGLAAVVPHKRNGAAAEAAAAGPRRHVVKHRGCGGAAHEGREAPAAVGRADVGGRLRRTRSRRRALLARVSGAAVRLRTGAKSRVCCLDRASRWRVLIDTSLPRASPLESPARPSPLVLPASALRSCPLAACTSQITPRGPLLVPRRSLLIPGPSRPGPARLTSPHHSSPSSRLAPRPARASLLARCNPLLARPAPQSSPNSLALRSSPPSSRLLASSSRLLAPSSRRAPRPARTSLLAHLAHRASPVATRSSPGSLLVPRPARASLLPPPRDQLAPRSSPSLSLAPPSSSISRGHLIWAFCNRQVSSRRTPHDDPTPCASSGVEERHADEAPPPSATGGDARLGTACSAALGEPNVWMYLRAPPQAPARPAPAPPTTLRCPRALRPRPPAIALSSQAASTESRSRHRSHI